MKEKDVEKKLVDGIKSLGGRAYKFVSPGNDGVPDRIVALPGARICFVELKTETGRLSGRQKVQIRRLSQLGFEVWVLYGSDQVDAFLSEMTGRMFTDGLAVAAAPATEEGGGCRDIYPARISKEGGLFYPGA